MTVIEEVDRFKKDLSEIGRNARHLSRLLDGLREKAKLIDGVGLDGGGTLRVVLYTEEALRRLPPELREDHGEFVAPEQGTLPRLIEWTDLKGSLHNHSNWSDGHNRLEEIAAHMEELGLEYWAVTDHSKSSFQANGLDAKRVREQLKEIRQVNENLADRVSEFRLPHRH